MTGKGIVEAATNMQEVEPAVTSAKRPEPNAVERLRDLNKGLAS